MDLTREEKMSEYYEYVMNSLLTATDTHSYISAELRKKENIEEPVNLIEVKKAFQICIDESIKFYDVANFDGIFYGGYIVSCLNRAGWEIVYFEFSV